eukprot:3119561-Heterocapsa_arctica.AAC.1
MCRASEYLHGLDAGKVLRGVDVDVRDEDGRVDVQFRKTKTDQAAFGCVRTHFRILEGEGPQGLCVVAALTRLRRRYPQRFGTGAEATLPLFRYDNGEPVRREDVQAVLERAAVA